jgi:hypothetical protein
LATLEAPSLQTVVSKELGPRNELPPLVSIPGVDAGWQRAGFLGPRYNPFNAGDPNQDNYQVRDMNLPLGVDWARMDHRRSLLSVVDEKFRQLDSTGISHTMDAYYQTAFDLMRSPKAKQAFDIASEPEKLREKYGRTSLGQGALLARRLVEAGVRFVTVSKGFNKWDHHRDIFGQLANEFLPELDRAYATLLEDLQQRGLLESTLVLLTGEFGRTPEINVDAGRDHWPNAFSLTLAGGGITGGRVWGASDENGMYVKDDPVQVPDLIATLYHKLGIDYHKEYMSNVGRPLKLVADGAQPLDFLLI